jgi:hypothetical protein
MKRPKQDIFAYNPHYEWTSYKTYVGTALPYRTIAFVLFCITVTCRDYEIRPPELVSHGDIDLLTVAEEYPFAVPRFGIRISYSTAAAATTTSTTSTNSSTTAAANNTSSTSATTTTAAALENANRYVRFQTATVQDCVVASIASVCPVLPLPPSSQLPSSSQEQGNNAAANWNDTYLQGTYYKKHYRFVEVTITKCSNDTTINYASQQSPTECAPLDEINALLESGGLQIYVQLGIEGQQIDVERFHATGAGITVSDRSFGYSALPALQVLSDIYLQPHTVYKKQRYIGSPPLPETIINLLSIDRRDTVYRPRKVNETALMTFVLRLSDNIQLEEISYWCPSLLDLFGLWGAMASFAASLSLGLIALQYNRWRFHRQFRKVALQKRRESQQQTLASMKRVRSNNNNKRAPDAGATNGHDDHRNREDDNNHTQIYENLQSQYDALMVEPDIRLFEEHHFRSNGRLIMSPEELKFPSTAFGELRRLAIVEHGKKKRVAQFISVRYVRHLAQKGFITDQRRLHELFSASSCSSSPVVPPRRHRTFLDRIMTTTSSHQPYDINGGDGENNVRHRFWSNLVRQRRRRGHNQPDKSSDNLPES